VTAAPAAAAEPVPASALTVTAAAAPKAMAIAKNRGLRHRAAISSESFIIAIAPVILRVP
jgi:hypothetical protein